MFRQSVSEILGGGAESAPPPPPPRCEMGPKSPALLGLKIKDAGSRIDESVYYWVPDSHFYFTALHTEYMQKSKSYSDTL